MSNVQVLSRGQRVKIADLGIEANRFSVDVALSTYGMAVDMACFGLDDARKLSDERYMTFFNQPKSPCGGITQTGPTVFAFDLDKLPASIHTLVLTLAVDDNYQMNALGASQARVCAASGDALAGFAFDGSLFAAERAVMLIEIYRKDGVWRCSPVGQGFNGGLAALVEYFGGEVAAPAEQVAEPVPEPVPAPKLSLSKVTLTKPGEQHRVSLVKGAGAPKKITVKAVWTDNGDGRDDNDDLDLRVGLLFPNGQMTFIQAPDYPGSFDAKPYVRHLGDVTSASKSAPGVEVAEVNPQISHLLGGPVALVFSVYSAVSNGAVSISSLSPKMVMEYGDQVVECACEFKKPRMFGSFVYTYVIGMVDIDGDVVTLSPSGQTSKPVSESTPWLTRTDKGLELTMDGPAVFKGQALDNAGAASGGHSRRYIW